MTTRNEIFKRLKGIVDELEELTTAYSGYEDQVAKLRDELSSLLDDFQYAKVRSIKLRTDTQVPEDGSIGG